MFSHLDAKNTLQLQVEGQTKMLEKSKQESKYPRNDSVVVSYSNSSSNNIENNFTGDIECLFWQFLEMVAQNN